MRKSRKSEALTLVFGALIVLVLLCALLFALTLLGEYSPIESSAIEEEKSGNEIILPKDKKAPDEGGEADSGEDAVIALYEELFGNYVDLENEYKYRQDAVGICEHFDKMTALKERINTELFKKYVSNKESLISKETKTLITSLKGTVESDYIKLKTSRYSLLFSKYCEYGPYGGVFFKQFDKSYKWENRRGLSYDEGMYLLMNVFLPCVSDKSSCEKITFCDGTTYLRGSSDVSCAAVSFFSGFDRATCKAYIVFDEMAIGGFDPDGNPTGSVFTGSHIVFEPPAEDGYVSVVECYIIALDSGESESKEEYRDTVKKIYDGAFTLSSKGLQVQSWLPEGSIGSILFFDDFYIRSDGRSAIKVMF